MSRGLIERKRPPSMRNAVPLFLVCACAATVSGSGVVGRAGVFATLTCGDLDRRSVINATASTVPHYSEESRRGARLASLDLEPVGG